MDEIHVLKVPQRYAQLYKQHLLAEGILDLKHCLQKHPNGTVSLPILPSALPSLDLLSLQSCVAQGSSCEILKIQAPGLKKQKRHLKSYRERITQAVQALVVNSGETWTQELEDDIPRGWQKHGDLVLFGEGCFSQKIWRETGATASRSGCQIPVLEGRCPAQFDGSPPQTHSLNLTINWRGEPGVSVQGNQQNMVDHSPPGLEFDTPVLDGVSSIPTFQHPPDCEYHIGHSLHIRKPVAILLQSPDIGSDLWLAVARALGVNRLAQIKQISQDGFRTPVVTMLLGESSYVTHIDNHIRYDFDVTKCMFSFGNITEKLRIASFSCTGETVVDLYAGIGYFTLPYLVHAGASHVHACEWNPDAVAALGRNLQLNNVADRCTVHQGDNKQLSLSNLADRVNLGLIPSSEEGWPVACRLLRKDVGGILHIHHNVTTPVHHPKLDEASDSQGIAFVENEEVVDEPLTSLSEREVWNAWAETTASRIVTLLREITGDAWRTNIKHIERVKSYAPHINHIVVDLECRPVT